MTIQEIEANIRQIQILISKGKTVEAIDRLIEFAPKLDNDIYRDTAYSISASKKGIINDEMKNLADSNDISIRKSQINNKILTLLTQIEDEKVEGKPALKTTNSTQQPKLSIPINWMIFAPIAIVGIGLLFYFSGFRQSSVPVDPPKSACELSFEKAKILFDNDIFDKAQIELKDIKYAKDCSHLYTKVDKMLTVCNQKLEANNSNTTKEQPPVVPSKGNTNNNKKATCELSVKKARRLMSDQAFAKARAELVDIKYAEACSYLSTDIDKMLAICDEQLDSKTFKILKTKWEATPQRHTGKCPVDVQFSGTIFTNQKSGSLQYFIEFGNRSGTRAVTKTIERNGNVTFSFPYNFEKEEVYTDKMKAVVKVINPKTKVLFYTSEPITFEIKCN